ncbi:glycosyltransferase family 1 protein [Pseudoxanthomonas broegbernensis]|uniref:Glycosyltransferase family 1 protein n=1 Tax=Pseudoxanthomonas broegbernensis TaxID=83619 RepID=A0A7V8K7G8_9GAMM|nr:glycosyltransferase family 4 protein [Pseudoxanthomonas broegbernensis]KAF1687177.1 glycosyltransferase family 1 protein [Pseudoxanthomonas broegbernensis]MBB6065842.1 glycosyltransferase involved in cell wall biosynthesis [Pseudoxanthomonas broegbernensis]
MKLVLYANTDWYLYNFRHALAVALRDAGHEVLLVSPPGDYGPRLRASGLRWEPLPMDRRSLDPLREAVLLWRLWRLFRRERPALVHGFTIKCAVYGALVARLAGVRARVGAVAGMGYVFTSHDRRARRLRLPVKLLMRLAFAGRGTRLVLQNPDDVSVFREAGLVPEAKIRLIEGSGVDCGRFSPAESRTGGAHLRVLLPARLLWDKGLAEYAEAARRLRAEGRRTVFLLAGTSDPGNPAAVDESTVAGWVDEGRIEWLGHVDDMPTLFRSVDVVVLPSYREGLPKGLIEAGACGLALVTTDVPGCREVVRHEADGLLVPPRDARALAEAIGRLDDDRALLARLGRAARAKAVERFDERIVIQRTLEVYRELLGGPPG